MDSFREPKKYKDIYGYVQKALGIQGYIYGQAKKACEKQEYIWISSESPRNTRIYTDRLRKPFKNRNIYG